MNEHWDKNSSSEFIKKPGKGWLHSDNAVQHGISYNVKYVGCIGINESMKSLSFEVRTQVARESIRRVAEAARLLNLPRRNRRNDDSINKILSSNCMTQWSGMNVDLHINTQFLKVTQLECNDILFQHTMQNISFACGGDTDIQDYVAYVAKDEINGRACYVFECADNSANNVITTIGQAFELRFRKFLSSMPNMKNKSLSPTSSNQLESNSNSNNNNNNNNNHHHNHHNNNNVLNNHTDNHHLHPKITQQSNTAVPTSSGINKKFNTSPDHINSNNTKSTTASISSSSNHLNNINQHTNGNQSQQQNNGTGKFKFDDKLEKMPWFHGLLTRENAEKLLLRDGDYLVRETNKAERQYVLSGRYKGECRHIFLVDPSGVVRTKDRVFDNICHLIQYHQDNNIPIISKENELLLEYPICK